MPATSRRTPAKPAARTRAAKPGKRAHSAPAKPAKAIAGISDAAVLKSTAKPWDHWLTVLDRFDVRTNGHKAAANHLHEKHAVPDWWCQMLVVRYEQVRGLRQKHQKADGFSASCSRVVDVPISKLFSAWQAPALSRWFPDPGFSIRKATRDKSMRITWIDGKTSVEVNFYAKGAVKSQVTVQHNKLASGAAIVRMKKYWAAALDALKDHLAK